MAEVSLHGVEKTYPNGFKAIHGIDTDIADGEFLVLVGPSGCGKSTLLRMVAGLETVTGGEIKIDGRVVNQLEPMDRDIAMVFQNYALYPHMNCYDNMAYGLRNRRTPKDEIERRVREAAKILELDHLLERRPNQLSGGQRQRVAMGRAIVREPSVFLFDEPLSNLDAKLRVQMRIEIKRLHANLGITSIYVTHDQVEAMTLGDRLMVLNEGHVEQIGTPIELYERPDTLFVAGFIGAPTMNFINGTVAADAASIELSGAATLNFGNQPITAHAGRPVTVGIRPEHVAPANGAGPIAELIVTVVEKLGADTIVHGHVGDDQTDLTVRLDGVQHISAGDRMPVVTDASRIHLFDPESGRRLADG